MSSSPVIIKGRFQDEKGRYEEIQNVLINGLSKHLEPDDSPVEWEKYFELKNNYLELDTQCYGNYGWAMDYLEKKFTKQYPDVKLEFFAVEYECEVYGDKIYYDGSTIISGFQPSNYQPPIIKCPECGNDMEISSCGCYCPECECEFYEYDDSAEEKLGLDMPLYELVASVMGSSDDYDYEYIK